MIEVPTEAEASAHALLERVQRGGGDLAREYPLVFRSEFPGRVLALHNDDQAVAACTALGRRLLLGDGTHIQAGLIGAVSTDENQRGRGLGTELLQDAEAHLAQEGALLSLLWAEDPSFYSKRGYVAIGTEHDWAVEGDLVACLPTNDAIEDAQEGDADAIHGLYSSHRSRVDRELAETRALLACPNMRTLVSRRGDHLVAYACLGRGADLGEVIHEWAGETVDVLALVHAHYQQRIKDRGEGPVFLMAPQAASSLNKTLEAVGFTHHSGTLAMAKILDPDAMAEWLEQRLGPNSRVVLTTSGAFEITAGEASTVLDAEMLLALCFPTPAVVDGANELLQRLGVGAECLPLYPFAWGLDSI